MEWSADGKFEDRASMVVINRHTPAMPVIDNASGPPGAATHSLTALHGGISVVYHQTSGPFDANNLTATCKAGNQSITWHPGDQDTQNLGGTYRTLDGARGSIPIEPGLLSRAGWTLIDDSNSPVFDNSDWPWVEPRDLQTQSSPAEIVVAPADEQKMANLRAASGSAAQPGAAVPHGSESPQPRPAGKRQDWYFLCYGHDYKAALHDFTLIAGKIPLPPLFAFGTWWSRYWAYTDQEFEDLVRQFHSHDVPLDVLVVDMDWHPTFGVKWWENKKDQSGHTLGWTGYSWNRTLFPDPTGFLKWLHEQGLKVPLNLHPASGVQPFEDAYPEMARAMGIDPATKKYVPFDIASKKFAVNYFNILHHPLEKQGVDFWWLDWQQEDKTSLPGVNPTWWLNYAHFTDFERRGKRGIIFHRWGGLGNHRYQIGFSGDTISVWESLAFQPYFTATAANVLYGYWSHDIGGHMPGQETPELYTRWIQWGTFSPILRTHTTKNPDTERRIWAYPAEYASLMRDSFLLRYALIPYIYSAARESYDTGVSMLRPMYYDYPNEDAAYEARNQYMFGDSMIVAPIATPVAADSELAQQTEWLPAGEWIEWWTGARLRGPAKITRSYSISQVPVFVKAGAIVAMEPKMSHTGEKPVDPLILIAFPGASGEARVYADEGSGLGYKDKQFTWTTVRQSRSGAQIKLEIDPVEGSYPGALTERGYEIRLPGTWPPQRVSYNGTAVPHSCADTPLKPEEGLSGAPSAPSAACWAYDGNQLQTVIRVPRMPVSRKVEVAVELPAGADPDSPLLDGARGKFVRLDETMKILNHTWPRGWSPDVLQDAVQMGERISLKPETAATELGKLDGEIAQAAKEIGEMQSDKTIGETVKKALAHVKDVAGQH